MKVTILTLVLLSGCASLPDGVQMTDAERAACAENGCSVWTVDELRKPISISIQRGYDAGKKSL